MFLLIGSLKVTLYSVSLSLLSFCVTRTKWRVRNEFEVSTSPAVSGSPKYCMVKTVCKQFECCKEDRMWGIKHMNSPAWNPHPPSNFAGLQHSEGDTYSTLYAAMLNASKVKLLLGAKVMWQVKFFIVVRLLCVLYDLL